jgi:hypothetical protein
MNTNALAKHYDQLTPRERLPLILAASARGDAVERERLARSGPRVGLTVPDHFGLAQAFDELSTLHLLELLNLAALYLRLLAMADADGEDGEQMLDCALLYGFVFNVRLAGWRLFCAEHGFPPELLWAELPGYGTVRRAERTAQAAAFTPEGAAAHAKRRGRADCEPPTAEGVAAGLREALRVRADWWG